MSAVHRLPPSSHSVLTSIIGPIINDTPEVRTLACEVIQELSGAGTLDGVEMLMTSLAEAPTRRRSHQRLYQLLMWQVGGPPLRLSVLQWRVVRVGVLNKRTREVTRHDSKFIQEGAIEI